MSFDQTLDYLISQYDSVARNNDGKLDRQSFNTLISQMGDYLGGSASMETSNFVFNGIDVDDSGFVTRDEFIEFAVAAASENAEYTCKLSFRAFDKNRSRKLEPEELVEYTKYFAEEEYTLERAEAFIYELTGSTQGLPFFIFSNEFMGISFPPNYDPYDHKLDSGCCLLI